MTRGGSRFTRGCRDHEMPTYELPVAPRQRVVKLPDLPAEFSRQTVKYCSICLGEEGVLTALVIEKMIQLDANRPSFQAFVCARCIDVGRVTKVNCRTFVEAEISPLSR